MNFYTNVRQWGDNILYIGYENGQRVQRKESFTPVLYLNDTSGAANKTDPEHYWKDGKDGIIPLLPFPQDSIKEAKEFIKRWDGVSGMRVYGADKFNYEFIARKFNGEIVYDVKKLRIFCIDIEVMSNNGFPKADKADEPVTVITIHDSNTGNLHVWGQANSPGGKYKPHLPNVVYQEFTDEITLLNEFVAFWSTNYPDIVTGWYSRGFDLTYITNRIKKLLGDKTVKRLSPWGIIQEKSSKIKRFGQMVEEKYYDFYGINELDYLDLYKKYGNAQESYKLGFIAQKILGETKIEFDGSLHQLYSTDYQKYVEYNIQDVCLIPKMEEKLRFIELIVEVSYLGKVATYNDSLGTVKYWEVLIYNHLYEKDIHPPIKDQGEDKDDQYEGAYVKSPIFGSHKFVVSVDLTSLYPKAIEQVNIGPDTLVDIDSLPHELRVLVSEVTPEKLINKEIDLSLLKKYNLSLAGNGRLFTKTERSFLSELMDKFFGRRSKYKKQMFVYKKAYEISHTITDKEMSVLYDLKQHASKILINAAYGAVGNSYFQYFSIANAEAVTITGRVVIKWAEKRVNEYLNKLLKTDGIDRIVYIDTDSIYISFEDLIKQMNLPDDTPEEKLKIINFLDKLMETKILPFIKDCYQELFEYMNHHTNHMEMKREIISDRAIWTGKKRYFMNVYDKEGIRCAEPELKVMGIEVVKSSTPQVCRDKLEECLKIILRKDNTALLKYIGEFKTEFKKLSAKEIAFPRSVNEISKYKKYFSNPSIKGAGVPMHVRAAIHFNNLIKEHGLDNRHEAILDGNKIRFVYLRTPNVLQDNVVGFSDSLPKEFNLDRYIDYDMQFQKAFLDPLEAITTLIGWETQEDNSFGSMFF